MSRVNALFFEQLPKQPQGGIRIAPFLDQEIEHFAFIVDGTPEPHPFATDLHTTISSRCQRPLPEGLRRRRFCAND